MGIRGPWRRRVVALAVLLIGAGLAPGAVPASSADVGDPLASFDAMETAGISYCGVGTGLAYDGDSLLLSCWYSNVIERVDAETHLSNGPLTISGVDNLGALAYDRQRDRLWACEDGTTVVRIDLDTQAVDPTFAPIATQGCVDGLAYDAADDTLWTSHDATYHIEHYNLDGTLIHSQSLGNLLGNCGNSGIAVGGEKLYLANNGCSEIYEVEKDFSASRKLSGFPERLEDLECDGKTFPGKGVIWSQDAYDRKLNAWEIPPGLCEFGGGGAANAQAYAVSATVGGENLTGGPLAMASAEGDGSSQNSLVGHDQPATFRVGAGETEASSAKSESGETATSEASLAKVNLLDGVVTAAAVTARAEADWDRSVGAGETSSAGSGLKSVRVNGVPVPDDVPANTTLPIPGGSVTLREELPQTLPAGTSIRVNMIHVRLDDGSTDIVVGSAFAGAGRGFEAPEDEAGAITPADVDSLPVPGAGDAPVPLPLPTFTLYEDGFDDADGWTSTTTGAPVWEIGTPGAGPAAGRSVAATKLDGPYPFGVRATTTSPTIDLTDFRTDRLVAADYRIVMNLDRWFEFMPYGWDCGMVEVVVDGTSELLHPEGGYPAGDAFCDGLQPDGAYARQASAGQWVTETFDLTQFAGTEIQLRLNFASYAWSQWYGQFDGMYVDDLVVRLDPPGEES